MKQTIVAATLFAALAAAYVHGDQHRALHGKRQGDDGVVTVTSDVWVTTTTTIDLPPGATAPAPTGDEHKSSTAAVPTVAISSAATDETPGASSTHRTHHTAATPSAPSKLPPQASSQASVSVPTLNPLPASSQASASTLAAPSQGNTGSNSAPVSGGQSTHLTYYDANGYGSCGGQLTDDSHTVAMEPSMLQCGKQLKITGPGGTFTATAADTCPGCTDGHLDIPQNFAAQIVGSMSKLTTDGVVPITWEWI